MFIRINGVESKATASNMLRRINGEPDKDLFMIC